MTPALPFIVAIAAGFCGLVALLCGVVGQPAYDRPVCRRCRRDVREEAWSDLPTCTCGASLRARRAIRWQGRTRSRSAIVAGIVLLVFALGAVKIEWWLRSNDRQWQDFLPASYRVSQLRHGDAIEENLRALVRRSDRELLDDRERFDAIEALLVAPLKPTAANCDLLFRLVTHASLDRPEAGDLRARALVTLDAMLGGWRAPPTLVLGTDPLDPFPFRWVPPVSAVLIVIDEMKVNGRAVPTRVVVGGRVGESRVEVGVRVGQSVDEANALVDFLRSTPIEKRLYEFRMTEYHVPLLARSALTTHLAAGGAFPEGVVHSKRMSQVRLDPPGAEGGAR